eukprot:m.15058 g.15058  ORF g.15058 m.15058 type:complete len:807 (+) comp26140_c0_seq1:165-2585(+)
MSTLPRIKLKRKTSASSGKRNDVIPAVPPPPPAKPKSAGVSARPDSELLDMLFDFQTDRLNDQRCSWPDKVGDDVSIARRVDEILQKPGPCPMVLLPKEGHWCHGWTPQLKEEPMDGESQQSLQCEIQSDEMPLYYRRHFLNKDHDNFYCHDDRLGPLLMSVRCVLVGQHSPGRQTSWEEYRVILRTKQETLSRVISSSKFSSENPRPEEIAKLVLKEQQVTRMHPASSEEVPDLIIKFDEHNLQTKHKFGIIFQRLGQTEEEEMFGNENHGAAMEEFLDLLGETIDLKGFQGYAGGLDVKNETTGTRSVFTKFEERDVMFHVSTLLPYKEKGDRQQLERKRHIGNDIVTVVFQNNSTPFVAGSIASQFLHVFIVVQAVDPMSSNARYKVSVVAKSEVPDFEPKIPSSALFSKGPEFRRWLLTKLVNAEVAARRGPIFTKLEMRTRATLLQHLVDKLKQMDVQAENSLHLGHLFTRSKSDSLPHLGPRRQRHSIDTGSLSHTALPFSPFAPSMSHDLESQRVNSATLPKDKNVYRPRDGEVTSDLEVFDSDLMKLRRQKSKSRRQDLLQRVQTSLHGQSKMLGNFLSPSESSTASTPVSYSPYPEKREGSCGSPVAMSGTSSMEQSPIGSLNSLSIIGVNTRRTSEEKMDRRSESVENEEKEERRRHGSVDDKPGSLSLSSAVFSSNTSSHSSESEEDIMGRIVQQLQNEVKKLKDEKLELLRETVTLKKENTELKRRGMENDLELKESKEEIKKLKVKVALLRNKQEAPADGRRHKPDMQRRYSDQARQYRLRILNLDESQATHL